MSRFLAILHDERISLEGEIGDEITVPSPSSDEKEKESIKVRVNFEQILSAAFTDILEKNSYMYQLALEKGVKVDFSKAFTVTDEVKGSLKELVEFYTEDMM